MKKRITTDWKGSGKGDSTLADARRPEWYDDYKVVSGTFADAPDGQCQADVEMETVEVAKMIADPKYAGKMVDLPPEK